MPATLFAENTDTLADNLSDSYQRHLADDLAVLSRFVTLRQNFEALARSIRDLIAEPWLTTNQWYEEANQKHVYYSSMEYLIGRSLRNNVINLRAAAGGVHEFSIRMMKPVRAGCRGSFRSTF